MILWQFDYGNLPGPASTVEERSLRKNFRPRGLRFKSRREDFIFQSRVTYNLHLMIGGNFQRNRTSYILSHNLDTGIAVVINLLYKRET